MLRWNSVGLLLIAATCLLWWIGRDQRSSSDGRNNDELTGYSPPPPGMPRQRRADANNRNAELGLAVNLDGIAVLYPELADGLVAPDGRFRTELSLLEMSRVLQIDPLSIAKTGTTDEVDPGAVLFTAVTGTLTDRVKALRAAPKRDAGRAGQGG